LSEACFWHITTYYKSPPLSLSHSLSLSHNHTLSLTLSLSHTHSLSLSHTNSLSLSQEHELRLVLDAGDAGTKQVAGSVFVRYCGFDGLPCGCEVDLAPSTEGLTVGASLWPWSSTGNCLLPRDVETTETGERVVRLTLSPA
jgi:hypothetical protein